MHNIVLFFILFPATWHWRQYCGDGKIPRGRQSSTSPLYIRYTRNVTCLQIMHSVHMTLRYRVLTVHVLTPWWCCRLLRVRRHKEQPQVQVLIVVLIIILHLHELMLMFYFEASPSIHVELVNNSTKCVRIVCHQSSIASCRSALTVAPPHSSVIITTADKCRKTIRTMHSSRYSLAKRAVITWQVLENRHSPVVTSCDCTAISSWFSIVGRM